MGEFRDFLIEGKWTYFPRDNKFVKGQRTFPFEREGGPQITHDARPYIDRSMVDDSDNDTDYRIYHVTTNLAGIIQTRRLMSRSELGANAIFGLGKGPHDPSNLVSATYDIYRARKIYDDMKFVVEMAHGQVKASLAFSVAVDAVYDALDHQQIRSVVRDYVPKGIFKQIMNGDVNEDVMDQYIKGDDVYEFYQKLETAVTEIEGENDDTYDYSVTGFSEPIENMKKINPSQLAIIQCAVKKGAWSETLPLEKEVRFRPADLKIIRYWQP